MAGGGFSPLPAMPVAAAPDSANIADHQSPTAAILILPSIRIWDRRDPMPGISGGQSFRGDRLPVGSFGHGMAAQPWGRWVYERFVEYSDDRDQKSVS
jgi:hypothetical protein